MTAAISVLAALMQIRLPAMPKPAAQDRVPLHAALAEDWAELRAKPIVARVLTLMVSVISRCPFMTR